MKGAIPRAKVPPRSEEWREFVGRQALKSLENVLHMYVILLCGTGDKVGRMIGS